MAIKRNSLQRGMATLALGAAMMGGTAQAFTVSDIILTSSNQGGSAITVHNLQGATTVIPTGSTYTMNQFGASAGSLSFGNLAPLLGTNVFSDFGLGIYGVLAPNETGLKVSGYLEGAFGPNNTPFNRTFNLTGGPGDFDIMDLSFIGGNGPLNLLSCSANITPVPIPATIWLFGSALGGLFGYRRFAKRTTDEALPA